MKRLALAILFVAGTATAQPTLPAFKPITIVGTILCREYTDLITIGEALQESLAKGRARIAMFSQMRDEVGLPLCAGVVSPITFTLAPHIEKLEGLHSLKGKVDSYVIPVLYRRGGDGVTTTGYIFLDKPVTEDKTPQGDAL